MTQFQIFPDLSAIVSAKTKSIYFSVSLVRLHSYYLLQPRTKIEKSHVLTDMASPVGL